MATLTYMAPEHVPVLASELIALLDPQPGETAVDCTFGGGGHARLVGERLGADGTLVCVDREDAITALGQGDSKRLVSNRTEGPRRPVVLLLPGIGDHYPGMAYDLYEAWPVFREEVDRCARLLEPHLEVDIRNVLYPPGQSWKLCT